VVKTNSLIIILMRKYRLNLGFGSTLSPKPLDKIGTTTSKDIYQHRGHRGFFALSPLFFVPSAVKKYFLPT